MVLYSIYCNEFENSRKVIFCKLVRVLDQFVYLAKKIIVYYAPRERNETLLTSASHRYAENTRVDKVSLPRGARAIFYNICVISDVFWGSQTFWGSWMRKKAIFQCLNIYNTHKHTETRRHQQPMNLWEDSNNAVISGELHPKKL